VTFADNTLAVRQDYLRVLLLFPYQYVYTNIASKIYDLNISQGF
jgi:hypothetical protein